MWMSKHIQNITKHPHASVRGQFGCFCQCCPGLCLGSMILWRAAASHPAVCLLCPLSPLVPSLRSCGQSVPWGFGGGIIIMLTVFVNLCVLLLSLTWFFCLECHGTSSGVSGIFLWNVVISLCASSMKMRQCHKADILNLLATGLVIFMALLKCC